MDVKPQRPLRIRVNNDENLPPAGQVTKTIHHRNKSSPALTGVPATQGLAAGAKRKVFGDVSNTTIGVKPVKDDGSLQSKPSQQAVAKPVQALYERKSTSLLRPAQRPLSVSGLKTLFSSASSSSTSESAVTIPAESNGLLSQVVNGKRTLSKRHTTIFKDNRLVTVQETEVQTGEPSTTNGTVNPKDTNSAQFDIQHQPCLPPPTSHIVAEPVKEAQDPQSEISLPGIDEVSLEPALSSELTDDARLRENVTVSSQSAGHPVTSHYESHNMSSVIPSLTAHTTAQTTTKPEIQQIPVAKLVNPVDNIPPLSSHHTYVERQTEQQEYWEEDEDDNYDEEGYVTARSFRSRGENTTGGATAMLFPQINQRVRKEIAQAKQLVEATRSPEEVEDESFDTSMVAEYGDEIFDYMRSMELKMLPNAHYMDNQHEIQWSMRSVLMDWLVQVHLRFNLLPETLFLTVNYIDRFLSCKVVSLGKLQLVGATAIFIAAKYEEINCPSVQEIVYMVDGGYTVDEILKAERFMLTMLQFELGWPGPMSFLRRISKADDYDLETRTLAKYFLEVTLMDERFIGSPPSFAAAASHCLARIMLRKGTWTAHHVYYSGYTYSQLKPLVSLLLECCDDPRKHHSAVFNKYCDKRYKRASAFVETEIQRGFQLPDPAAMVFLAQPQTVPYYDSISYYRN
ncbi:B-type cyclin [Exophiala xenobiotica]|uniref:B-type cyclin n=1 Tax=Vermiconidia calcicola TaxID=1690605 RepID=A0AAV9QEA7_9PEZI|nr:B-type cyclin [Exophiala xenobiotica]KAK5539892.1 B-type cyclin [Vermiconidia calcicola]KAK5546989.1 B-type cyclin [Chaetothyriales sp. CCFEE 6169]KAK5210984.1 B-type cyclin [Exophiala xenobiotica]KAK5224688.1 B-type cyclin [Exophiala xenobiotica]